MAVSNPVYVASAIWQIALPLVGVTPKTYITESVHLTDTRRLTAGVNYMQSRVTQTGKKKLGTDILPTLLLEMFFFHKLVDPDDESPVLGPSPDGVLSEDVEVLSSRTFWRADGNQFVNKPVRDLDGDPIVTLDKSGDIIHYSIALGIVLEEV